MNIQRVYLDTNIYILGFMNSESNSSMILHNINRLDISVTISDHLMMELFEYFRRKGRRNEIGMIRKYLLSIPNRNIVERDQWSEYLHVCKDLVADVDDLPHICCYIADGCDQFVTTNRRLTRMKIEKMVNFISPVSFVELLGLEGLATKDGI